MVFDRLLDPDLPAPLVWFVLVWLFAVGGCIGSFMNVVIYRLPAGLSLLHPPSRCPVCETPIRATDNVPIFGWLWLGGRCRTCRVRISPRYPAVELLAAVLFAGLAWVEPLSHFNLLESGDTLTMGQLWGLYAYQMFLLCSLVCAALIEFDGHALPRRLTATTIIVGLAMPMFWPELRLYSMQLSISPAVNALVDGVAGALLGAALGCVIGLTTKAFSRGGLTVGHNATVGLTWVGAFLGWQIAAIVAIASLVSGLAMAAAGRLLPVFRRIGLTTWITMWCLGSILSLKALRMFLGSIAVAFVFSGWFSEQSLLYAAEPTRPTIVLTTGAGGQRTFELRGLSKEHVAADAAKHFAVYCVLDEVLTNQPPLTGRYRKVDSGIQFAPLFPLQPGMKYRAVYQAGGTATEGGSLVQTFELPPEPQRPPSKLLAIYPTAATLPQNQLKFYLYFSAPMSRGDAYRNLQLLDADGRPLELPFLELAEELWNPAGDRLTLLLDPARVKQDLKPRQDQGPVLLPGRRYSLIVDREWPDADGRPLATGFRKRFSVGEPDEDCPNLRKWKLEIPTAASRSPLTVGFGEPLDRALLDRMLWIVDGRGRTVSGQAEIGKDESSWSFRPDDPWQPGEYRLTADVLLEDLAGNSIARKFELTAPRATDGDEVQTATVDFRIPE